MNLEFVNLREVSVDKALIDKIPVKIPSYYKFVPLKIEDRVLTIAVSYPLSVKAQDEIRTYLGYEIKQVLVPENEILETLKTKIKRTVDCSGIKSNKNEFTLLIINVEMILDFLK